MPQLFTSIMDAERSGRNATTVCELLTTEVMTEDLKISGNWTTCATGATAIPDSVYINTILIGLITGIGFVIAGFLTKFISDVSLICEYYIRMTNSLLRVGLISLNHGLKSIAPFALNLLK